MKHTLKDFKVGDTVYLRCINNAARMFKTGELPIREATIDRVGRKYLTVQLPWAEVRFEQNDSMPTGMIHVTEYSQDYVLYKTKEELLDDLEKFALRKKIEDHIRQYAWARNLTLDEVKQIAKILRIDEAENV